MTLITAWLAKKAVLIVVLALAVIGLICGPVALYQTARINGVAILWWHPVRGLKADLAAAQSDKAKALVDLAQSRQNASACTMALNKQNDVITAMGAKTYAMLAGQAALVAAADKARQALAARQAVYLAAPPAGADECARYRDIDVRFVGGLGK